MRSSVPISTNETWHALPLYPLSWTPYFGGIVSLRYCIGMLKNRHIHSLYMIITHQISKCWAIIQLQSTLPCKQKIANWQLKLPCLNLDI